MISLGLVKYSLASKFYIEFIVMHLLNKIYSC